MERVDYASSPYLRRGRTKLFLDDTHFLKPGKRIIGKFDKKNPKETCTNEE